MDSTPMSGGISLRPVACWGFLSCVAAGMLAGTGAIQGEVDSVVVFNEVHYHPADPEEALEFVELFNQNSVDVDLSGWSLDGAGTFVFPSGSKIAGRGYLVLARNPQALEEATGYSGAMGPLPGRLSNGGERLVLRNHNQRSMDILEFDDGEFWPVGADGCGASLSKIYPWNASGPEVNWRASEELGGSPGEANRWSEDSLQLLSEVDPAGGDLLRVELFHSGNAPVVLEGLRLELTSGAALDLSGPPLAGGAYRVFEVDTSELNSEAGDRLFLADPATNRLLDAVILAESPRARLRSGSGDRWLFADAASFGDPNHVELEDAVVINEIMYHHRPRYRDPNGSETYAADPEEWVELFNRSNENIDLSGWSFAGGIGYVFPAGTVLEAGSYLVATASLETFQARHGAVMAVGDFERSLSNGGDYIELRDARGNPADSVRYADGAPWPDYADGGGSSLELRNPEMDNSVPEAWEASREDLQSEWEEFVFRGVARRPVYTATVGQFHELRMGLLEAGECLVDDVSVVADPDGSGPPTPLVKNGSFLGSIFTPFTAAHWRFLGNHDQTEVKADEGQPGGLMHLRAASQFNYLNNIVETTLREEVVNGRVYEIRFRAKWLRGNPMLRSEIYYNKLAWVARLPQPEKHGTPGRRNSTWEDNPGPTFSGVTQDPVLPAESEPVRIRAQIGDPAGLAAARIRYRVQEGAWQEAAMASSEEGKWEGVIPGQANRAVVQFYLEAEDELGGVSTWPRAGEDSRALYRTGETPAPAGRQSFRIVALASEGNAIHDSVHILSNRRRGCTVILNDEEIFYDCGVRLRGSMFSRTNGPDAGLNVRFPADHPFRGVQGTVTIRRRNIHEILVKHLANEAGNVPASYNDIVQMSGYLAGHTGPARIEMARFGNNWVGGAFDGDKAGGTVFKMEGIRDFQSTNSGQPDGIKLPMPIGWIVQFDLADLGDDPEQYRHVLRINTAEDRDDYSGIIALCKAFSLPDAQLRDAVEDLLDVDQWMRMMAIQTLCGIADVYPIENPHNFDFYVPPNNRGIQAMPWDWDFTFNLGAGSRIYDPQGSRKNLWRVMQVPGFRRLFEGHLLDLIDTVFNNRYADAWFDHYGDVAGANYGSYKSYVGSRGSSVRQQVMERVPFAITSNGGADFLVDSSEVELRGTAWVNVRAIRRVETGDAFEIEWINDSTWSIRVPVQPGENVITLQAEDFQGTTGSIFSPMGSDSIRVTSSARLAAPTGANLTISELHYHPADPSPSEEAAGFASSEDFEFVELLNIGPDPVDLSAVRIADGVVFDFAGSAVTELAPGERVVVVQNLAAFLFRYGPGLPVAGAFTSGLLANDGETLRFEGIGGSVIKEFAYSDGDPWPEEADGEGYSLVFVNPEANLDPNDPANWVAGSQLGGTPGRGEGETGDPLEEWRQEMFTQEQLDDPDVSGLAADPDGDGLANTGEFLWGGNPLEADATVPVEVTGMETDSTGALLAFLVTIRERTERGAWRSLVQYSVDLREWAVAEMVELSSEADPDHPGMRMVRLRIPLTGEAPGRGFLRLAASRR